MGSDQVINGERNTITKMRQVDEIRMGYNNLLISMTNCMLLQCLPANRNHSGKKLCNSLRSINISENKGYNSTFLHSVSKEA